MSLWQCGDTALMSASIEGNDATVELLIEAGAIDAEVDEVRFALQEISCKVWHIFTSSLSAPSPFAL